MSQYKQLAADIIKNVGGKENVIELRHCVTRLRFTLADESKANDEVLKNMDGVITIMKAMEQYMVVIGEHVPDVYNEVMQQLNLSDASSKENVKDNRTIFSKVLAYICGSLGPCLPILCATGVIKGVTTIAMMCGLSTESGIYLLLNAAGDAFFYFLPLFLGYNVAKRCQIDPFVGMLLAAVLSHPTIQNVPVNIFGLSVTAKYQGTFFPVLVAVAIAAPIYKLLDKKVPKMVKTFLVPMLTILIVFPITFAIIGPVVNWVSNLIPTIINSLLNISPILTCIVLAGLWQVIVLFGVHGPIILMELSSLMQGVPSVLLASTNYACFAQIAVVGAILLKTKDKKLKSVALPAFVSGIFGVTEPAIYGVTLPRIKMFVISCIGAAVSGVFVGLFGQKFYYYSGNGVFGLLGHLNPENPQVLPIIITLLVTFCFSFILAYVMYKPEDDEDTTSNTNKEVKLSREVIVSPINGQVKQLSESKDDAFAMGDLGKGVLLIPKDGKVYSPCDGIVRTLFPTKHAVGIVSHNGCEVLIHIGLNTVTLEGKHYTAHVAQGDQVKKGQLLITFDKDAIEKEGFSVETPVIITNSNNYLDVVEMNSGDVSNGDDLLTMLM